MTMSSRVRNTQILQARNAPSEYMYKELSHAPTRRLHKALCGTITSTSKKLKQSMCPSNADGNNYGIFILTEIKMNKIQMNEKELVCQ